MDRRRIGIVARIALMMLVSIGCPLAKADEGTFRVFGEGTISCGAWLSYRQTRSMIGAEVEAWVRGFLSGARPSSMSSSPAIEHRTC